MVWTASTAVKEEMLNDKRQATTCSFEPGSNEAAAAAAVPVCVSMASDGSISDYGDSALKEAQTLLSSAGDDPVFRVGAQHSGPSIVHPTVKVIEVVA